MFYLVFLRVEKLLYIALCAQPSTAQQTHQTMLMLILASAATATTTLSLQVKGLIFQSCQENT